MVFDFFQRRFFTLPSLLVAFPLSGFATAPPFLTNRFLHHETSISKKAMFNLNAIIALQLWFGSNC